MGHRVLAALPMQWLGRVSYGLYLWHLPVVMLLMRHRYDVAIAPADFLGFYCLALLLALGLATLSYFLLEQPLSHRVARRRAKMAVIA